MAYPFGGFRLFMPKGSQKSDHVWLVMIKAMHALTRYATAGIEGTGLGNSDFRVLEVLLHKGPLPVNTIGPIVNLTPGSISIAVERLVEKGLVSRVESAEDRRVRVVALTPAGKNLIVAAFQKHAAQMRQVFSELSAGELRDFEMALKRIGKRAAGLMEKKFRRVSGRRRRPAMSRHTTISPQEAADRLAIRELVEAYAHCADRRDAKGQMSLFTEGTHFVVYMNAKDPAPSQELRSREELAPVFADLNKYDATTHFIGQSTLITLEGDRATGEAYCLAHHVTVDSGKKRLMVASLRYSDTFVKIDGSWFFAERLLYVDWREERPLS